MKTNELQEKFEELKKLTQVSKRLQELEDEGLGDYIYWDSLKLDFHDFMCSFEFDMTDLFEDKDKKTKVEDLFLQYDEERLGGVENGVWTEEVFKKFKSELEGILNEA